MKQQRQQQEQQQQQQQQPFVPCSVYLEQNENKVETKFEPKKI